jgi:hypothetical protein
MNRQATRHIVPSQARGYADRSNRERREPRHPAIASPRANVRMAVVGVARYAALIAPSRSVTK